MRTVLLLAATAPFFLAALPASADDRDIAAAISVGAYTDAEQALNAQLRANPGLPELLLNLAAVYAKTGRDSEARAIYAQVLAQRDVMMDLPSGKIAGSHAIATTGLKLVTSVQITSR
ncbi:MAG: tetratricopeptide repeat protein [Sphingomonadales bacterium]|nr:MAG: tetratricopeptide repeat protein [Sphingomonadales bacterium]